MLGLIKDLVGLLNQLNRNTLILRLIGHLVESSFIDLPIELRGPKKGLLNIKNKDQKCFLWRHVRHILQKNIQEKLRKLIEDLLLIISTIMKLSFLCKKIFLRRLKYKIIFVSMYLAKRISWSFQFMFLIKDIGIQ